MGLAPPVVAAIILGPCAELDVPMADIDERLARVIEDPARLRTPAELTRVVLPTSTPRGAWATHAASR